MGNGSMVMMAAVPCIEIPFIEGEFFERLRTLPAFS
jgi:hypothetical protein